MIGFGIGARNLAIQSDSSEGKSKPNYNTPSRDNVLLKLHLGFNHYTNTIEYIHMSSNNFG
jgi:hypothetical protein